MCPFTRKFSRVAAERDYAARAEWEAEWDGDDHDPEGDGPIEAVIPTTDGPALVDLVGHLAGGLLGDAAQRGDRLGELSGWERYVSSGHLALYRL